MLPLLRQRLKDMAKINKEVLEKYPDQSIGMIEEYVALKRGIVLQEFTSDLMQVRLDGLRIALNNKEVTDFMDKRVTEAFIKKT